VEPGIRYEALYARPFPTRIETSKIQTQRQKDLATKAREAALLGLKHARRIEKARQHVPRGLYQQKQPPAILFNYTAGNAAMTLKDYAAGGSFFLRRCWP